MINPRLMTQTMITLASASLGLVAALAWNEAIKAFIKQLLGEGESLAALFIYAIAATLLAIVVLLILARPQPELGVKLQSVAKLKASLYLIQTVLMLTNSRMPNSPSSRP